MVGNRGIGCMVGSTLLEFKGAIYIHTSG